MKKFTASAILLPVILIFGIFPDGTAQEKTESTMHIVIKKDGKTSLDTTLHFEGVPGSEEIKGLLQEFGLDSKSDGNSSSTKMNTVVWVTEGGDTLRKETRSNASVFHGSGGKEEYVFHITGDSDRFSHAGGKVIVIQDDDDDDSIHVIHSDELCKGNEGTVKVIMKKKDGKEIITIIRSEEGENEENKEVEKEVLIKELKKKEKK